MECLDSRNQRKAAVIFVGLAEAVLDVHSAHTNFAAKKTSAATADWIKSLPYRTKGNNLYYRVVSHLQKIYTT